jgi:hypothetical protein
VSTLAIAEVDVQPDGRAGEHAAIVEDRPTPRRSWDVACREPDRHGSATSGGDAARRSSVQITRGELEFFRQPPIDQSMIEAVKPAWLPLGTLLVRAGLITHEQLELALIEQQGTRRRLGELLVEWGWVASRSISAALAEQYEMDFVELASTDVDRNVARALPEEVARAEGALPIRKLGDGRLLVGVADPTDVGAAEKLRARLGVIRLAVVDQTQLAQAIDAAYA